MPEHARKRASGPRRFLESCVRKATTSWFDLALDLVDALETSNTWRSGPFPDVFAPLPAG